MPHPPAWHCTQRFFWSKKSPYSKRSATMGPTSLNVLVLSCSLTFWSRWLGRTVKWPSEDYSVRVPARWQYPAGQEQGSPEAWIGFESVSNIRCCFSHNKDSDIQQSGSGNRSDSAHRYPSWLTTSKISALRTFTVGLEIFVPEGGMLTPRDTKITLLNWKWKLTWPFWDPHALNQ